VASAIGRMVCLVTVICYMGTKTPDTERRSVGEAG
jgi:hypothetical protein